LCLGLLSRKKFPKRLDAADEQRIDMTLERLNIADIGHKMIGGLSGGQQQRVLHRAALVNDPDLLLLDRTDDSPDPETRENFFEILADMNSRKKVTRYPCDP